MPPSTRTRVDLYFRSRFERAPQTVEFAPGRIVLLGEHLDHQGGVVLAVPLALGVHVAWGMRPDRRVTVHALNARATDSFTLGAETRSGRVWADLARGVFASLGKGGRRLPGLDLAVLGDLPPRKGLGSSAAYVTALLKAVLRAVAEERGAADVARLAADVERTWAGVACGPMDPYVAAVGGSGTVVRLDNASLEHEVLSLPRDAGVEPEDTGIERRLDRTPYNERRRQLREALAAVRAVRPDVARLVELAPEAFEEVAPSIPDPLARRARHVVTEAARVGAGAEALRAGDAERLGSLLWEGHASLARDFECSLPEIDRRIEALRDEPGVLGARLQGAGWGGSLVVLRRRQAAEA